MSLFFPHVLTHTRPRAHKRAKDKKRKSRGFSLFGSGQILPFAGVKKSFFKPNVAFPPPPFHIHCRELAFAITAATRTAVKTVHSPQRRCVDHPIPSLPPANRNTRLHTPQKKGGEKITGWVVARERGLRRKNALFSFWKNREKQKAKNLFFLSILSGDGALTSLLLTHILPSLSLPHSPPPDTAQANQPICRDFQNGRCFRAR